MINPNIHWNQTKSKNRLFDRINRIFRIFLSHFPDENGIMQYVPVPSAGTTPVPSAGATPVPSAGATGQAGQAG